VWSETRQYADAAQLASVLQEFPQLLALAQT
jgi:hypothetical protein